MASHPPTPPDGRPFWKPNLARTGRVARTFLGLTLLAGAIAGFMWQRWAGFVLLGSAAFVLFEAARGWCLLRACGIKTRL